MIRQNRRVSLAAAAVKQQVFLRKDFESKKHCSMCVCEQRYYRESRLFKTTSINPLRTKTLTSNLTRI